MPEIELKKISHYYGQVCALENVELNIEKGKLLALIGPNGGGKSTLISLITGVKKPTKGRVIIPQQTSIGFVEQGAGFDIDFPMTVKRFVMMGALDPKIHIGCYYNKNQEKRAMHQIQLVGLKNDVNKLISELSGGQLRRAMIARAMASNPKILVLDEPDANLDGDAILELYKLLRELKKEKTIVMASHNVNLLLSIADIAMVVNKRTTIYNSIQKLKQQYQKGVGCYD